MNFNKMTKQPLVEYAESIGIKLNLKHKKDDLIDQLNNASQTTTGDTIKTDIKVEVTNATTEKAFKAVSDTILSGKKAATTGVKTTTGFVKKIAPVVVIVTVIFLVTSLVLWTNPENLWDFIFQGNDLRDFSSGKIIKEGWK